MNNRFALIIFFFLAFSLKIYAQKPANPIIEKYGTIYDFEGAIKAKADQETKLVIDIKTKSDNQEELNFGIVNIARLLNLHAVAGISKENLKVAVAIHGPATTTILDNEGYQKKYGVDNPHLELLKLLNDAEVEIYVCGQSLIARGYEFENVDSNVQTGLSMLTIVTEKMNEGYDLMVFQ